MTHRCHVSGLSLTRKAAADWFGVWLITRHPRIPICEPSLVFTAHGVFVSRQVLIASLGRSERVSCTFVELDDVPVDLGSRTEHRTNVEGSASDGSLRVKVIE